LVCDLVLLSVADLSEATIPELLEHARSISSVIPITGFFLQPAVGGRLLPHEFWRQFIEIENVVAIKIAPFNRYQTIDGVRGRWCHDPSEDLSPGQMEEIDRVCRSYPHLQDDTFVQEHSV